MVPIRSVNFPNGSVASAAALRSITMELPNVAPVLASCVNDSTLESISRASSFVTLPSPGMSPNPASIKSSTELIDLVVSENARPVLMPAVATLITASFKKFRALANSVITPAPAFAVFWNFSNEFIESSISLFSSLVSLPLFFKSSLWSSRALMAIFLTLVSCLMVLVPSIADLADPRKTRVRSLSSEVMSLSNCSNSLSIWFYFLPFCTHINIDTYTHLVYIYGYKKHGKY